MSLRALRRTAAVTALAGGLVAGLVTPASAATTTAHARQRCYDHHRHDDHRHLRPVADGRDGRDHTRPRLHPGADRRASSTSNLAVVLDIDNTALASYFYSSYPTPADPPVLALAQYAASKGVKIFFITARPDVID